MNAKAVAEITRTHPWWVKALDKREHVLEIVLGNSGVKCHFFRRRLEKTIVIDVTDNELGRFAIIRIQDLLIELGHQVLLQRLGGGSVIEKELEFLFVLVGPFAVAARFS